MWTLLHTVVELEGGKELRNAHYVTSIDKNKNLYRVLYIEVDPQPAKGNSKSRKLSLFKLHYDLFTTVNKNQLTLVQSYTQNL